MGVQITALDQRMKSFNSAMNTNTRTFQSSVIPIKQQGDAFANLNKNLVANQTQITTLGSKIKTTTGNFAGFATGLSATASGVLQLNAGFRDYGDAQIAVDKATRRLSLATEAQAKARDKLEGLQSKGIKSGKALAQAQLDLKQADEQVAIQTQLVGERQEDMFDAQT